MDQMNILLLGIAFMLIALLVTLFIYLVYCGLLHSVTVKAGLPPIGGFTVAYKFCKGPYKDLGSTFCEAHSIAPKLKTFGVFYDDPREVEASELRCGVGCILAEGDQASDPNHISSFRENGYHLFCFPAITSAVSTTFPFRNMMSVILANLRVYPALTSYIEEHKLCGHPFLEIYDGAKINYMVPLARQDDFYVPETVTVKAKGSTASSEENADIISPSEEQQNKSSENGPNIKESLLDSKEHTE